MTGYRVWTVQHAKLRSIASLYDWTPGPNTAFHPYVNTDDHLAPKPDCTCGLYFWSTLDEALGFACVAAKWAMSLPIVVGQVEVWGRIIEHEKGLRAQYAQVVRLVSPYPLKSYTKPEVVCRLSEIYDAPVRMR
jgi:hypothetical protein